jgi:hypothetical protein
VVEIQIKVSNDGARAAKREILAFLEFAKQKAAKRPPEYPHPTASSAYVVLRDILDAIERAA